MARKILMKIWRIIRWPLLVAIIIFAYVNLPVSLPVDDYELGLTFSSKYSKAIGLDWKENLTAILDEVRARKIRIPVYWDEVEKEEGQYDFSDIDWQLDEIAERNGEVILVLGQKVPRWPECFIPEWAQKNDEKRKKGLIKIVRKTVERYKSHPAIKYWQVENEPFLEFGICPELNKELLDMEIEIVKMTDPGREIIITDSGEISLWLKAAKQADIFGTTMYKEVNSERFGHWKYPIGPNFFKIKRWLIKTFVGQENVIVIELQGEPWLSGWTTDFPLEDQFKSMNPEKLRENVEFARKTGINEIYLWGGEWWYWLKSTQNHPEIWEEAKEIFKE